MNHEYAGNGFKPLTSQFARVCGANVNAGPWDRRLHSDVAQAQQMAGCGLELVEDLIDPEALEAGEGLVEAVEFVIAETTDLVDRL